MSAILPPVPTHNEYTSLKEIKKALDKDGLWESATHHLSHRSILTAYCMEWIDLSKMIIEGTHTSKIQFWMMMINYERCMPKTKQRPMFYQFPGYCYLNMFKSNLVQLAAKNILGKYPTISILKSNFITPLSITEISSSGVFINGITKDQKDLNSHKLGSYSIANENYICHYSRTNIGIVNGKTIDEMWDGCFVGDGKDYYALPNEIIDQIGSYSHEDDVFNFTIALGLLYMKSNNDGYDHYFKQNYQFRLVKGDYPDGLCYLNIIENVKGAFNEYGYNISGENLLHAVYKYGMSCPVAYFTTNNPFIGHISSSKQNNSFRELKIRHKSTGIHIPLNPQVIRKTSPNDWEIYPQTVERYGSTGNFCLADLAHSQNNVIGFYSPSYHVYQSEGKRTQEPSVELVRDTIIIAYENMRKSLSIGSDELGKIPHEYVASKLKESTDMPLSVLGIEGEESVLTPDFIDPITKKVLELATNQSESIQSLINDFEAKRLRYEYLLKPKECNAYYLIVGKTSIVTNLLLNKKTVDDLCARFRIGLRIKMLIIEETGVDLSNSASSEDKRLAQSLFSNIKMPTESESEHYSLSQINSILSEPNIDDLTHAKSIVSSCLNDSRPRIPKNREEINKYLSNFKVAECVSNSKRITNIPLVLNSSFVMKDVDLDPFSSDMHSSLKHIWESAQNVKIVKESHERIIEEALKDKEPDIKHKWKKQSTFVPKLTENEKIHIAKSGVGAKFYSDNEEIKLHEEKSKMSFHPSTNTEDIENFIKADNLSSNNMRINTDLLNLILKTKEINTRKTEQYSTKVWMNIIDRKLIAYFDQVTEIFSELSFAYKQWTVANQFLHKVTKSGIHMVIRNTKSHIFVSYAFPRQSSSIIDTGRLGPTLYMSKNYIFTDFCSYNEPTLEHFVKAGPYMASLLVHLMSSSELEPGSIDDHVSQTFNLISLLYLNNKTDSEELLTSQRYLFMKLFEDATQDPYIFIDRLPTVLRSRLCVHLLNQTILLMDYYRENRVIKVPEANGSNVFYNYLNIKSIVDLSQITISQKINEFYYGYVISKERGRGSDRNFKIVKKILQEEYKFRDNVKNVFKISEGTFDTYCTDPKLMSVFLHLFKSVMKDKVGENFQDTIYDDFLSQLSFTNFTQLATLKASAKDHTSVISTPENVDDSRQKVMKSLSDRNKNEMSKRPKVLEALLELTKAYKKSQSRPVKHMMQLIPWCLSTLEGKGYFDSDIFPKPQHGGDREIHVLEISARLVQYAVELISRVTCRYFISETITHPHTKDNFVKDHYAKTKESFKSSFVISKSADASKWCQRHHVSHFSAMLMSILPNQLHGFVFRTLKLWTTKMISFPLQLVATLLVNKTTKSNTTYERFRDEFYSGTGIFNDKMSNKIQIKSGMMQGILHYTSSLYHTMIQEVSKMLILNMASRKFNLNIVCTIVQGSDDSGMMFGVEGKITPKKISDCYTLLRFKEEISQYLSVYWNVCKSSIGTIDLIEYNSEWHVRGQVIKPTFRWISACMELSVTEKFIDRVRIFYQILTQCLEGGASTLECSVVQLCQCWMHYLLLGISTSELTKEVCELILKTNNPLVGFFPMDYDICCGLPGVDYQMFVLANYAKYQVPKITDETTLQYEYEGQHKSIVPNDLKSIKLKFGKLYLWKSLVSKLDIGTLEDAIDRIQKDPMILFGRHTSWDEELPNLVIKVFSPGVKESINNISSCLRMMSASAYILNRPCMSYFEGETLVKCSLFKLLKSKSDEVDNFRYNSVKVIKQAFPLMNEYTDFHNSVHNLTISSATFTQKFKRSNKEKVIVFEVTKNEHDLMELCKRKWHLSGKVSLSSRQFDTIWSQTQMKFPFLKDSIFETADELKMTIVELKNFIESLKQKNRQVVLHDTTSKHGGLEGAITRIYWPNVKIRSELEGRSQDISKLRSHLFSILSFWYTDLVTQRLVLDTIKSYKFLRKPYSEMPIRARKLKTIHDWACGSSTINLIDQIKQQKQGVVGFFTYVQKGHGNSLYGYGEWRGQIMGISCIIELNGNTTSKIKLNHLADTNVLGQTLKNLLIEFKCFNANSNYTSNLLLGKSGKISTKRHIDGEFIPIELDTSLRIDIIKDMEKHNWQIEVRGTTVRLVLSEIKNNRTIRYTILSESMSQSDWNPDYTINSSDEFLNNWNNNKPMSLTLLEKPLNVLPDTKSRFLQFFSSLSKQTNNNAWNLSKFRDRLMTMTVGLQESISMSNIDITQEYDTSTHTMLEIQNIMDEISLSFDDNLLISSNLNWADEMINEQAEIDDVDISDEIKATIISLAEDLEPVYNNPDVLSVKNEGWWQMSMSNKFFSNLDKLSEIQTNSNFYELYKLSKDQDNMEIRGTLGRLMSLCIGRFMVKGFDSNEGLTDIMSESSRQVDTILSEADLSNLDMSTLENNVRQLDQVLSTISGAAKLEIEKVQQKYKRLILLKLSPTRTSDLDDVDYSDLMTYTVRLLFNQNLSKFSHHHVEDNLKLSLIKIEMIEYAEKQLSDNHISNHEFTLIRENINSNSVSTYLLETLADCYNLNIHIGNFTIFKDTSSPSIEL